MLDEILSFHQPPTYRSFKLVRQEAPPKWMCSKVSISGAARLPLSSIDPEHWWASHQCHRPHLKTPHIDRLAKEGIYFKNAFCTTSLCSPSRASLVAGERALYCSRKTGE